MLPEEVSFPSNSVSGMGLSNLRSIKDFDAPESSKVGIVLFFGVKSRVCTINARSDLDIMDDDSSSSKIILRRCSEVSEF